MKRSCLTEVFGTRDGASEAHNTLLQSLFTVGFVGTVPFVAALGVLVWRGISRPNPPRDLFTCYLIVSGVAEAEIVSVPELLTLAALLIFAYDAVGRRSRGGVLVAVASVSGESVNAPEPAAVLQMCRCGAEDCGAGLVRNGRSPIVPCVWCRF